MNIFLTLGTCGLCGLVAACAAHSYGGDFIESASVGMGAYAVLLTAAFRLA